MAILHLTLLGGFQARDAAGAVLPMGVKKAKALLAYLALRAGEPQTRDRLAGLLWEDSPDAQARHSLRQALASLRKALPKADTLLRCDSDSITLARQGVWVDVQAFEALAAEDAPAALAEAMDLYAGEFLEGFNPRSSSYEDWLMAERSRLRARARQIMTVLLQHQVDHHADEPAIQTAIRLLALDPLRESVHRTLMELYARQGRTASALKQYRLCRAILSRELGINPEPATDALYQTIRQRRAEASSADAEVPLAVQAPELPASTVETDARPPELRQATVLCVNLAGFDDLSAHVGPETLQQFLAAYQRILSEAAAPCGGALYQRFNDTALVAFGVPTAHGNDTERAVHAALAIRDAVAATTDPGGAHLAARIGVCSGTVLVSAEANGQLTGSPPSQAAALAATAAPGEIVVNAGIRHSLERLDAEPMASGEGWRVLGLRAQTSLPPLVGRQHECQLVVSAVTRCQTTGCGQSFLIRGEAGIGKTRLTEEVQVLAQAQGFACHRVQVLDFGAGSRDPLRSLVRSLLALAPEGEEGAQMIESLRAEGWLTPDQRLFLKDLLGLLQAAEDTAVYAAMDNATRHGGQQAVLAALVQRQSRAAPRLLVVEDVHWADALSLGHLAFIADVVRDCPALLVMTSRLEDEPLDPAWRGAMHGAPLTTLDLGPLRPDQAWALARQMNGGDDALAERCVDRAEGNPLFLEQLLRAASGADIPASIQSVVWARLDRLSSEDRRGIQAASVLGQRFDLAALRYLLEQPGYTCDGLLAQRLVRPQGEDYIFAHDLIREGIYASLLGAQRRLLHLAAAAWFAERDPILHAQHLDRAADPTAAAAYLTAARVQAEAFHYEPALTLLARALELAEERALRYRLTCYQGELLRAIGAIESSVERFQHALTLAREPAEECQAWIGVAAGQRVLDCHETALASLAKAQDLAEHEQLTAELAHIHYHRGSLLFPLGRLDDCLQEHQQAMDLARRCASAWLEARATSGVADAYYQRGRLLTAFDYFGRCLDLCRTHGFRDIEIPNRIMYFGLLGYQNRLVEARRELSLTVDMATQVGDKRDEGLARNVLSLLASFADDWPECRRQAELSLALARALGTKRFEAENLGNLALALIRTGEAEQALALLDQAFALSRASGLAYSGAWLLSLMALAHDDPDASRRRLSQGAELLRQGTLSHNALHFYQNAMEVSLALGDWAAAAAYADALADYTRLEPFPWATFYSQRGRALARCRDQAPDADTRTWLEALRAEAEQAGLTAAKTAIEAALARA